MSATYPKFREALLAAGINLLTDTIRAQLVDTGAYTYADAHQFLTSVPAGARIGDPVTLASKTNVNGVFDAANISFTAVPAGSGSASAIEAILIYKEGANAGASPLIGIITEVEGDPDPEPLSVIPNGGDINVTWPSNGILAIL